MPVWESEGYPGWLTHWGDRAFARNDFVPTLRTLLNEDRSFSLYVVHGGTNFGFGAGANANDDYSHFQPVITSYDYGAPIDERGVPRHDYFTFRSLIADAVGRRAPAMPAPKASMSFSPVIPEPFASLWDNLPAPVHVERPEGNELLFGQGQGMVLYRRLIPAGCDLEISGVRDYALVFRDREYVNSISRVVHPSLHSAGRVRLPVATISRSSILEILIDSFGHTNYGHAMIDRKGLVGDVRLDGVVLRGWDAFSLPLDAAWLTGLRRTTGDRSRPGIVFKAALRLDGVGDCYLDMSRWDKGYVWVNGHLLGRYWKIGPQQRLYAPGPFWKVGRNEILVLDLHRLSPTRIDSLVTLSDPPA